MAKKEESQEQLIPGLQEQDDHKDYGIVKIFGADLRKIYGTILLAMLIWIVNGWANHRTFDYLNDLYGVKALGIDPEKGYPAWQWFIWQWGWMGKAHSEWFKHLDTQVFWIIAFGMFVLYIMMKIFPNRKRAKPIKGLHGTAHFARNYDEVKETGLLMPEMSVPEQSGLTKDTIEKADDAVQDALKNGNKEDFDTDVYTGKFKAPAVAGGKEYDNLKLFPNEYEGQSVMCGGWIDKKNEAKHGKDRLLYLRHGGPEHIMALAPTRSGKGVGLINPTLLSWQQSCVVNDIKGELWTMTSGWRSKCAGNTCIKFAPADAVGSAGWNVLSEVQTGTPYAIQDVMNIVTILVDPEGKGIEGDHWAGSAHNLLTGVILFQLEEASKNALQFVDGDDSLLKINGAEIDPAFSKTNLEKNIGFFEISKERNDKTKSLFQEEWKKYLEGETKEFYNKQAEKEAQTTIFRDWTKANFAKSALEALEKCKEQKSYIPLYDCASDYGFKIEPVEPPSLFSIGHRLSDPNRDDDSQLWEAMKKYDCDIKATKDVINQVGSDLFNLCENGKEEYSSVLSTTKRFLNLYRNPIVRQNTAHCDFKVIDLVKYDRPVSLYIVVKPPDADLMRPLLRLLLTMILRKLTSVDLPFNEKDNRPEAPYPHRILMMMDEFPAFKKLDIFEETMAYVAGYGIKCYIICQDFSQLTKQYTENESITSNCHIRIAYAPNKVETAKKLSEMLGTMTVNTETSSESSKDTGAIESVNTNYQNDSRPLMTADEILNLRGAVKNAAGQMEKPGEMLDFIAGKAPILGVQPLYFLDPVINKRSTMTPLPASESIRRKEAKDGEKARGLKDF